MAQADAWVERLILAALHQQRFAEALEWAAHARAFLGRGARDALVEGRLEAGVGVALLGLGDRDGALAAERRALALDESELGPNHITLTRSLTAQGNILRTLGRYDEALAAHRRSMKIREALLDDTHPGLAISYNGLGRVLLAMGKVDEAIEEHEKAKRLLFGGDLSASPLESAKTLAMLGEALRAKGDHARALAEWSDALERVSPLLTPSHPMRATLQRDVARAAIATGDPTRAATAFGAAVEGAWPVAEKTALTLEWAQTLLRTRAWKPAIDALGALEGAEAHWVRAQAWRELKDPAKSTREAQAAIQAFTAQADEARAAEVQSWLKPAKVTRRKR